ncbi:MAG: T9SS type A sorting domain-containing protein [Bacteroidota bacterium]
MKKTFVFFFQVTLILLAWKLPAQQNQLLKMAETQAEPPKWDCASDLLMKKTLADNPGLEDLINQINQTSGAKLPNSNNTISSAPPPVTPFIIPVVFHVINDPNNPTAKPSYAQIQMQLASLNAAFSNNLNTLNNVATGPRAVNTLIQFCLAKKIQVNNVPTAWPTSSVGVIYYSTTNTIITNVNINSSPSLQSLTNLTSANFPVNMYLNIYCVPNIATSGNTNINAMPSVIGIGTFPWMSTTPLSGIVMRNDVIGNNYYNNFTNMFAPLDKGNILVHEAGHYLGLFHSFETIVNSAIGTTGGTAGCYGTTSGNATTDGDLIFDTPPTMINGQIAPGVYNTCNENYSPYGAGPGPNVSDQIENFMSYIDDDHMNTFSFNQAERMWGALGATWSTTFLNGQRASLVTSTNLTNTGVNTAPSCGPGLLNANFTTSLVTSAITCSTAGFQFFQPVLPGYLSATTHTWYFGDNTSSNAVNPFHVYNTPPTSFTVTLVVSNGTSTATSTLAINVPTGAPTIVGFSGKGKPVCRGTEQTIIIRFPPFILTAILTDGTNNYVVTNNFVHNWNNPTRYEFPYTFTITNSATYSLSMGSCNTSTAVASFTVVDCCNNLVNNGDLEQGIGGGITSGYNLTTGSFGGGNAAVNTVFGMFANCANLSGQCMMIDASSPYVCNGPAMKRLLFGQTLTGLLPNTNYYVAFKADESVDSLFFSCANKFNYKLWSTAPSAVLLDVTCRPVNVPPAGLVVPNNPGTGQGVLQVFAFMVTTPGNINAATVFSLQLSEINNRQAGGFDYLFDNFIVARMGGAVSINPLTQTICPGGSTQLTAVSNCSNISGYSLVWQPPTSLSCSTCINPIASPSVTTVYTLIAIPPITVPPSQNVIVTTTVYVNASNIVITTTTLAPCFPASYSLTATGVPTATWQPGNIVASSIPVSPASPTTYTASYFDPITGCLNVSTITITPPLPVSLAVGGNSVYCTNAGPAVVTATAYPIGSSATFTWQPGSLSGPVQNLTPLVNTIYTISATINGCPVPSVTFAVQTVTNCCPPSTVAPITQTLFANQIVNAPGMILNDITISGNTTFQNGEFLMGPNVKITVLPGSDFTIQSAHLYACGLNMWAGIDVLDGAHIGVSSRTNVTLIEDAVTAINLDNITNSHWPIPIDAYDVIFNKNYVAIKVANGSNVTKLDLNIEGCVFTSRGINFTPTSWPGSSTIWPDLRCATSPTNNLPLPYSLPFTFPTNLKNPYTYQPGHIGIQIMNMNNASATMPTSGVAFGSQFNSSFNLFDVIGTGVEVTDASLTTMNNVFQSMLHYYDGAGNPVGGTGIKHTIPGLMNAGLYLDPPAANYNPDFGNRFWDCYYAVEGYNVYEAKINHAIVRSNQKTWTAGQFVAGYTGVLLSSNRFNYDVSNNQFNNINDCIVMPLTSGSYSINGGAGTGIIADNIAIKSNYFGPEVSSNLPNANEYINNAVRVDLPNGGGLVPAAGTGLFIHSNNLDRVLRGITVVGMDTYLTEINGNLISHLDDNVFSQPQKGIDVRKTLDNVTVRTNTLSGQNMGNPLLTLIYCENNNSLGGNQSPVVICNDLSNSYTAFEFNDQNPFTRWQGNTMDSHQMGLLLANNGVIGTQGVPGIPSDNKWNGPMWSSNWHTFVMGSDAAFSPLFVNSFTPYFPFNNGGAPWPMTYNFPPNLNTTFGAYDCLSIGLPYPPLFRPSQPTGVGSISHGTVEGFNLYPNPTDGNINVTGSVKSEKLNVRVFDVSGKEICNKTVITTDFTGKFNFNAENGIYLVEITDANNAKIFKKIVVAK